MDADLEASGATVAKFAHYLVGQDPLRIEHHWQYLYRWSHFRGAAIWGRSAPSTSRSWVSPATFRRPGAPAARWRLPRPSPVLRARVRRHHRGTGRGCRQAKADGYTAVGHLTPFLDEPDDVPYFETHVARSAHRPRAAVSRSGGRLRRLVHRWGALPLPLAQPRKPRAMTAAARVPANHPDLLIVFLFMASSSYWWQMVHCWLLDRPWHLKQLVGSICASKRCTVR